MTVSTLYSILIRSDLEYTVRNREVDSRSVLGNIDSSIAQLLYQLWKNKLPSSTYACMTTDMFVQIWGSDLKIEI